MSIRKPDPARAGQGMRARVGETFDELLSTTANEQRLKKFADLILEIEAEIGFPVSARGYSYLLEARNVVSKDEFLRVRSWLNNCRERGLLPVDIVPPEHGRDFHNVVPWDDGGVVNAFIQAREQLRKFSQTYWGDWLQGEQYYIQMIVEKSDLVNLFLPVCKDYNIPISSGRGWSSVLQRAEYARRFAEAEKRGLRCVLLYCGDLDPAGLQMSTNFVKHLEQVRNVKWRDGAGGYDPANLEFNRFGVTAEFMKEHNLSWTNNLISATGKDLASTDHRDYTAPHMQAYFKEIGKRKAEAYVMLTVPEESRRLARKCIEQYLGRHAVQRFKNKQLALAAELQEWLKSRRK